MFSPLKNYFKIILILLFSISFWNVTLFANPEVKNTSLDGYYSGLIKNTDITCSFSIDSNENNNSQEKSVIEMSLDYQDDAFVTVYIKKKTFSRALHSTQKAIAFKGNSYLTNQIGYLKLMKNTRGTIQQAEIEVSSLLGYKTSGIKTCIIQSKSPLY